MAPPTSRQSPGKGTGPRPTGILPIPASATQKRNPAQTDSMSTRIAAPRLKLVIRRLPPALTEAEFEAALGDDWKVNGGKVDWVVYKAGKTSKDPAKLSKPTRVYLHLTKAEYINQLDQKIRTTTFNDSKGSSKDPSLLGPPTVEFAPYGRVPTNRPRKDARQGTIDQDPEFIEFLESLTNPLPKATMVDQDSEALAKAKEKVTTTPLIQYLRDKKANKGKEPITATKGSKHNRHDSKDSKASSGSEKKTPPKPVAASSPEKRSAQAIKVENAARDAVMVLSKQAAKDKNLDPPSAVTAPATATSPAAGPAPLAEKKRERGNVSVAARILERDLGLNRGTGGRGGRGGRRGGSVAPAKPDATPSGSQALSAATVEPAMTAASTSEKPAVSAQNATPAANATSSAANKEDATKSHSTKAPTSAAPPTGPAASRVAGKPNQQPRGNNQTPPKPSANSKGPIVSPTATQAFLKHANPSQGITEPLLEEAFSGFGAVKKVEIDKKKGFAYVDFAEPDGLQKAVRASPIKVAQGQVIVLERKVSPTLQSRNARGGPSMAVNRGGGVPMGPRGGRGGSMRRGGGPARPPVNVNLPKPPVQTPAVNAVQPTTGSDNTAPAAQPQASEAGSTLESTFTANATPAGAET